MKTFAASIRNSVFLVFALAFITVLHAQEAAKAPDIAGSDEYFVGYTPMSPSVWNSYSEEPQTESKLREYLFREAYLAEAQNDYLGREGRMFTIPTDDLTSTQRKILSPYQKKEEEDGRREYAEAVTSVVVNKGVPEYALQLLGLQKLREGVKKIEKAIAVDVTIGKPPANPRNYKPWKFRTTFLPFQRSYKLTFTNTIWSWDVQGGYTTNKGDMLFTTVSARWGRFLQSNMYQFMTSTGYSSLSYFVTPNLSLTTAFKNEFQDDEATLGTTSQIAGLNYIF